MWFYCVFAYQIHYNIRGCVGKNVGSEFCGGNHAMYSVLEIPIVVIVFSARNTNYVVIF